MTKRCYNCLGAGLLAFLHVGAAPAQVFDLGAIPAVHIDCLATSPKAGSVPVNPFADGSWKQFRRDRTLTGRSPLIGNITCPQVIWTVDLGARKHWVSIRPGTGSSSIELPVTAPDQNDWNSNQWFDTSGSALDLDGDGNDETFLRTNGVSKIGDFLPDLAGYERVSCDPAAGVCTLENYQDGWHAVWTTEPLDFGDQHYALRPLVGDFDNDGALEVAICPWYAVHVFDLATGELEQSGSYFADEVGDIPSGRGYGWFGAFNLDDDPKSEFVVMGNFEQFISVIGWRDGELQELWDHHIELGIAQNQAVHQTGVHPVADIDGDGHPEIVTSILNESGDGRWHVVAFDGLTGDIELDLPNSHLAEVGDLDGDGVAELFVSGTRGRVIREFGKIRIVSFLDHEAKNLWSNGAQGFAMYEVPEYPWNADSGLPFQYRAAFLRGGWMAGNPVFATQERVDEGPDIILRFFQSVDGVITRVATARGPRLDILSLPVAHPERGILLRAFTQSADEGPLQLTDLSATVELSWRTTTADVDWNIGDLTSGAAVAALTPGSAPTVIVQDYRNHVRAFQVPHGDDPQERWRAAGHGMISGEPAVSNNDTIAPVLLANIDGSGRLATVVASQTADSAGTVRALDDQGQAIWETSLDIQGGMPPYDAPGITNWLAGHFTSADHEDIAVSFRRSIHTSEELHLLDGRDGQEIWVRQFSGLNTDCPWAQADNGSGVGGTQMPVFDWDGDGLDDLLDAHHNLFDVIDGQDGSLLLGRWVDGHEVCANAQMLFAQPIGATALTTVGDFTGHGDQEFLYGMNDATLAVLRHNGDPVWNTPIYTGMPQTTFQGVGNLEGDPGLEIVSAGHCADPGQEVQVFNAADGSLLHTLALPAICDWPDTRAVKTGDIDGDGYDEALVSQGNEIYALGMNSQEEFAVLWRARFADVGILGDIVIADVDDSHRPQILVVNDQDQLYALGNPEAPVSFNINAGVNDAWFNPDTPGQGFLITVFPQLGRMFLAWFTFDSRRPDDSVMAQFGGAGHRWLTAYGPVRDGSALLDVELTTGGLFDRSEPKPTQVVDGSILVQFNDCRSGLITFDLPAAGLSGKIPIQRVAVDNVSLCESLQ